MTNGNTSYRESGGTGRSGHICANSGIYVILAVIIVVGIYSFIRISLIPKGWEVDRDVFYHMKMAEFFPDVCTGKVFPWTQLSVWKEHFYDKELGFHAVLHYIIQGSRLLNIPSIAPFNFINILMVLALVLTYTYLNPVRNIMTRCLIPVLLLAASPAFFARINVIRPLIFSIMIFAIALHILLADTSLRRKMISIFILSWIYALSYTCPHFIFIPIFSYCLASFMISRSLKGLSSLWIALSALFGILSAYTIHPQFPNTFYGWYVPAIAIIGKLFGLNNAQVNSGLELLAPSLRTICQNMAVYILIIAGILLVAAGRLYYDIRMLTLLIISFTCAWGFFSFFKFIEYATPLSVVFFTYALDSYLYVKNIKIKFNIFAKTVFFPIIALFCFFIFRQEFINKVLPITIYPCYGFAAWAQKNVVPGTYIGHIRWDEFPRLFYVAPQFRYSMALDPMFSYCVYPEATSALGDFIHLKKNIPPDELKRLLETDLVFISILDPGCAKSLMAKGAKPLYTGYDGWLLKL